MILKNDISQQSRYSKINQIVKPLMLPLSCAIALSIIAIPVNAGRNNLGDLEIYKAAESGGAVLTLMLDTSGSMNTKDMNGETRLTVLKRSLKELLSKKDVNGNYILSSSNMIGLGNYSVDKTGNGKVNGKAGRIIIPARKLDANQRTLLINAINDFSPDGGTPAANAYAEAGAYMMGTNTVETQEKAAYKILGRVVSEGGLGNYTYTIQACNSNSSVVTELSSGGRKPTYIPILDCIQDNYRNIKIESSVFKKDLGDFDSFANNNVPGNSDDKWTDYDANIRYYLKKNQKGFVIKDNDYSGYVVSNKDAKDPDSAYTSYQAPVSESQCSGYGIYFLTDGEPNNSSNKIASSLMNLSLTGNTSSLSLDQNCSGGLSSNNDNSAWSCMGEYSKLLRNINNPSKRSILTAAVGFGKDFAGIKTSVDGAGNTVYHCDEKDPKSNITPSTDVKNLCKLGSEEYGGGGFYYTTDADSLAESVSSFTAKLTQIIETAPSGTITIPNDPLSSTNLQPFAYLPMLEPKIADSKYVWPGNLKKYNVYQGTLYGKSTFPFPESARLYVDDDKDGFPDDLSNTARDLWSNQDYTNDKGVSVNNAIYAGGAYARLKAPTAGANANSTRNVYVESGVGSSAKLVNIKVENNKVLGFEQLDSDYGVKEKLYLLSFLGYSVPADAVTLITDLKENKQTAAFNSTVSSIISNPPAQAIKVLGGVVHSKPKQVSYGATFDDDGEISNDESKRDDYIMFGSMDGALHLVTAEKGEETFAFIPKTIIKEQLKALKADSEGAVGRTVFGVDAPWTSSSVLEYDFSGTKKKVKAKSVRAYGGLRMGGRGIYGLELTTADTPKFLFSKTPSDEGFSRLGQVWSEPTVAKIRVNKGANKYESKDVVIVAGGYDMCYENPSFKLTTSGDNNSCNKKTQAEGNAVYILDASNGDIIASISGSNSGTNHTKVESMKHSVVAGITALDRDDDGNIDHLYYADLGGSVYRVDLNAGAINATLVKRVVRVLNTSSGQGLPYRFYERPIVSFYTSPYQEIFASVTVASGDRSTPLSMLRNTTNPNYLFNLFDYDIAQSRIFSYTDKELITKDKVASDLINLPLKQNTDLNKLTSRKQVLETIAKGSYKTDKKRYVYDYSGWRYPLTNFDGYSNLSGIKSVGEPLVYGNRLYTTAFSPEMVYDQADNCSARVVGGSERQVYCMPYGVCSDGSSIDDGTAGYTRAGKGIQELTLGAYSKDKRNVKMLIGNQSLAEQVKVANRNGYGVGSGGLNQTNKAGLQITNNTIVNDGTTGSGGRSDNVVVNNGKATSDSVLGYEKYKLIPKRWYELYEKDKKDK
ncbi:MULTISPECIES: PilC/PilY family type IV pilus protein [Psychrobacter]|uniref:PilC/PilY family type IV pilus protein n=1 Tax=Psychrobacter TaxID=497 RepID=UPI00146B9F2E|nr:MULTISPECIES: PilC/PilY family type IV pilus protein [Psychrobacter]